MASFLTAINDYVEEYLRYALQLHYNNETFVKLSRFFLNLIIERAYEFVDRTGCSSSGEPGKTIIEVVYEYLQKTLPDSVYRINRELSDVERDPSCWLARYILSLAGWRGIVLISVRRGRESRMCLPVVYCSVLEAVLSKQRKTYLFQC